MPVSVSKWMSYCGWKEEEEEPVLAYRKRVTKTLLILLSYLCVGYTDSIVGVNLGQFQLALGPKVSASSLASFSFLGFTVGSIILSLSFLRGINLHSLQVSCLLTQCVMSLLTPHLCSSFPLLASTIFINGLSGGIIQVSSMGRLLLLWGSGAGFFLQVLDLFYAVGSMLGPFASAGYLLEVNNTTSDIETTDTIITPNNVTATSPNEVAADDLLIVYPYSFIGGFAALVLLSSLWVRLFLQNQDEPHPSRIRQQQQQEAELAATSSKESSHANKGVATWKSLLMVILTAFTYASSNGMLSIEGVFLTQYVATSKFNLPQTTGASMIGTSWIVHVVAILPFALVIKFADVSVSLMLGMIMTLGSSIILVLSIGVLEFYSESLLWMLVVGISIGGSTFFGPLVAFMEMRFPVSPQQSSMYLVPNYLLQMVAPVIVGSYFHSNPDAVIYSMAVCGLSASILVVFIVWFGKMFFPDTTTKKKKREEVS